MSKNRRLAFLISMLREEKLVLKAYNHACFISPRNSNYFSLVYAEADCKVCTKIHITTVLSIT